MPRKQISGRKKISRISRRTVPACFTRGPPCHRQMEEKPKAETSDPVNGSTIDGANRSPAQPIAHLYSPSTKLNQSGRTYRCLASLRAPTRSTDIDYRSPRRLSLPPNTEKWTQVLAKRDLPLKRERSYRRRIPSTRPTLARKDLAKPAAASPILADDRNQTFGRTFGAARMTRRLKRWTAARTEREYPLS